MFQMSCRTLEGSACPSRIGSTSDTRPFSGHWAPSRRPVNRGCITMCFNRADTRYFDALSSDLQAKLSASFSGLHLGFAKLRFRTSHRHSIPYILHGCRRVLGVFSQGTQSTVAANHHLCTWHRIESASSASSSEEAEFARFQHPLIHNPRPRFAHRS